MSFVRCFLTTDYSEKLMYSSIILLFQWPTAIVAVSNSAKVAEYNFVIHCLSVCLFVCYAFAFQFGQSQNQNDIFLYSYTKVRKTDVSKLKAVDVVLRPGITHLLGLFNATRYFNWIEAFSMRGRLVAFIFPTLHLNAAYPREVN